MLKRVKSTNAVQHDIEATKQKVLFRYADSPTQVKKYIPRRFSEAIVIDGDTKMQSMKIAEIIKEFI